MGRGGGAHRHGPAGARRGGPGDRRLRRRAAPRAGIGAGRRLRRSRRHGEAVVQAAVRRRAAVAGLVGLLAACGGGAEPAATTPDPGSRTAVDPTAGATLVTDARAGSTDPGAIWLVSAVSQQPAREGHSRHGHAGVRGGHAGAGRVGDPGRAGGASGAHRARQGDGSFSALSAGARARPGGTGAAGDARARRRRGSVTMAEITYLEAIRQGLWEEMERDERVFILGEDVGAYGGAFKVTDGFLKRFGEARVIDTPISEAAIVGAAAGAAHMGLRPVAEMQFIDFISCAYDMLTNYVATARYRAGLSTPMVVRGPCGGYVRGGPFHSQNPEAAFLHTPGLKIVYPATARDAKGLIKASIRDEDPVLYLEHKWLYRRIKEQLPEGEEILTPIGQARIARDGKHLSIISYGATLWKSLEAAEQLEKADGVSVEVLDLRTLLPMDDAAIVATVKKTNKVLIVHEDTRTGGIAGEIAARINEQAFEWLDGPIMRVTAHDVPLPYAPTLEDFVLPQTEDIVKAARWLAKY